MGKFPNIHDTEAKSKRQEVYQKLMEQRPKIPKPHRPRPPCDKSKYYERDAQCPTCDTKFRAKRSQVYCNPNCRQSRKKGAGGRWTVLHRDKFRCIYCGKAPWNNSMLIMHIDHIHPLAKGGTNTLSNLVTSCSECNVDKSATLIDNEEEILKIVENRNREKGLNPKRIIKLPR